MRCAIRSSEMVPGASVGASERLSSPGALLSEGGPGRKESGHEPE